jgi:predicted O-methyltransferase YrrM
MTVYNDRTSQYITELFAPTDEALQEIYKVTPQKGLPAISIKPEEGRFLQLLVRASGGQRALEIGTLGGYSGSWIARGLAPGGRLITLEKEPNRAEVAREHFALAGVSNRVEIRIGDAHRLLEDLIKEEPFDFVFIDAEKSGYTGYFNWSVENVRPGGIIAAHNAFRKGSVTGEVPDDEFSEITRIFNQSVARDHRVISTIFPAGDGTLVAVKVA